MKFLHASSDDQSLSVYEKFFSECFPHATYLRRAYLAWLYGGNPEGGVIGYDAWDGERLAAHYACIPIAVNICGSACRGLLAVNTATHPDYQGKGLSSRLAEMSYQAGADAGYAFVLGVANSNSTPGARKLGFQLVTPLDVRIGFGNFSVDWRKSLEISEFRRVWTPRTLDWRINNPLNQVILRESAGGGLACFASARAPFVNAYTEIPPIELPAMNRQPRSIRGLRLFMGSFPEGTVRSGAYVDIPVRLRPRPLNLIYRSFGDAPKKLDPRRILFSFLDFDAY